MKKTCILILALACMMILAGCSCEHEWTEADCMIPKTCTECGETEGEALGHSWVEATCTTVKACSRCGLKEGDALGHAWTEATCTEAKTCGSCGEIVGSALGHTWTEATTEAPKTCTVCNATEGERIITDPRFVSANTDAFVGRWESEINLSEEDLDVDHFNGSLEGIYWMEFGKSGEMEAGFALKDEETFREAMAEYCADLIFDEVAEHRADEEEANATAKALLGMEVEEYILFIQREKSVNELVEELLAQTELGDGWSGKFVYYVQDQQLYWDTEWKEEMEGLPYEFIGTTLLINDFLECKAVDPA